MYTTIDRIESRIGTLSANQTAFFNGTLDKSIDAYINLITGTKFVEVDPANPEADSVIYVDGTGNEVLTIPTMYSITSVYKVYDDSEALVDSSAYNPYPRGASQYYALRNKSGTWDEGWENYKITGKLGYASIPDDISAVATEIAVNSLTANVSGLSSEKIGDWSATYIKGAGKLSPDSISILNNYARLSRST